MDNVEDKLVTMLHHYDVAFGQFSADLGCREALPETVQKTVENVFEEKLQVFETKGALTDALDNYTSDELESGKMYLHWEHRDDILCRYDRLKECRV
jgi:hypothetical protein